MIRLPAIHRKLLRDLRRLRGQMISIAVVVANAGTAAADVTVAKDGAGLPGVQ